jgi:hypothetical protein
MSNTHLDADLTALAVRIADGATRSDIECLCLELPGTPGRYALVDGKGRAVKSTEQASERIREAIEYLVRRRLAAVDSAGPAAVVTLHVERFDPD